MTGTAVTRSTEAAERPTVGQGVPRPRKEEETTTSTPPIEGSSPPIEGDATQHERRVTKRAARKAARKHAARTALSGRVSSEARTELSAAADGVPRSEEARQEVLRLADEEAKRVLEAARVWAELLEVQAVQKAEATRARLEADARSSQREAAELMQGHTSVARSLLAEELRLLDVR